jgi:hypothetical protein
MVRIFVKATMYPQPAQQLKKKKKKRKRESRNNKEVSNSKLQDIKSIYKNQLCIYILTTIKLNL